LIIDFEINKLFCSDVPLMLVYENIETKNLFNYYHYQHDSRQWQDD